MPRTIQELKIDLPDQNVHQVVAQFIQVEGFHARTYKGETVYKKGMGLLMGPQYFKYSYMDGVLRTECWIKFALLPGIYIGEMDLKGGAAAIPKRALKKKIDNLWYSLCPTMQPMSIEGAVPKQMGQPANQQPMMQQAQPAMQSQPAYQQDTMPQTVAPAQAQEQVQGQEQSFAQAYAQPQQAQPWQQPQQMSQQVLTPSPMGQKEPNAAGVPYAQDYQPVQGQQEFHFQNQYYK